MQGHFIAYNIMICQDFVPHYARKNARPKFIIKLDLQKAYDIVECGFIEEILNAFQFPELIRKIIMNCVTTPRFTLITDSFILFQYGYYFFGSGFGC